MANVQLGYQSPKNRLAREEPASEQPRPAVDDRSARSESNEGPSVFLMGAYFLGLASIAVIVIGGHFPWFTLAPALVLLMFVHVRRVEAKYKRKSTDELLKAPS